MPEMNEVEAQAVAILWEKEGGVGQPPEEDAARMLAQIRTRAALIEQEAVEMGMARMREGRMVHRRHQRMALAIIVVVFLLFGLVALILSYWPF